MTWQEVKLHAHVLSPVVGLLQALELERLSANRSQAIRKLERLLQIAKSPPIREILPQVKATPTQTHVTNHSTRRAFESPHELDALRRPSNENAQGQSIRKALNGDSDAGISPPHGVGLNDGRNQSHDDSLDSISESPVPLARGGEAPERASAPRNDHVTSGRNSVIRQGPQVDAAGRASGLRRDHEMSGRDSSHRQDETSDAPGRAAVLRQHDHSASASPAPSQADITHDEPQSDSIGRSVGQNGESKVRYTMSSSSCTRCCQFTGTFT